MDYQEAINALKLERISLEGKPRRVADFCEALNVAVSAMQELQQYKQLGTLEEVREAVERQKPKHPIIEPWSPAICPTCGEELSESLGDGYYRHKTYLKRCTNAECAQRLDWSKEE